MMSRLLPASLGTLLLTFAFVGCTSSDGGGDDVTANDSEDSDAGDVGSSNDADDDGSGNNADDDLGADDDTAADDDTVEFGPASPSVSIMEPEPAAPAPAVDENVPSAEHPLQACESAVAVGENPMIDDFEDLDDIPLVVDNRDGGWYSYTDDFATTPLVMEWIPTADPAVSGTGVMHVQGSGYEYSGVGFGLRWTETGSEFCYYDASYYDGIAFWAKGGGSVRLALQNPSVRPVADGGQCPETASCYDSHGYDVTLTPDWSYYRVAFAGVTQAGWGTPVGDFLPEELFTVEFQFPSGTSYDVTIDDVAFYNDGDVVPEPEPMPEPQPVAEPEPTPQEDAGPAEVPDAGAPSGEQNDASAVDGTDAG